MTSRRRNVVSEAPGRVAAVVEGLRRADGDVLLVLDPRLHYEADDLLNMIEPLLSGAADLTFANRVGAGRSTSRTRDFFRALTGASDPWSGLAGLTRPVLERSEEAFRPVGGTFSLELLARVKGRRADVIVGRAAASQPRRPGMDDLRHLKRLADHRFGNFSRLVQFCVVGASGMVVDLSCYAALQTALRRTWLAGRLAPMTSVSLDLAVSAILAVTVALAWNFSLNRRLTFSYARHGSIVRQFFTYALSNLLGVLVSLALRLTLPAIAPFFNQHRLAAAVVGIVTATGISFSMARWFVFGQRDALKADEAAIRANHRRDPALAEANAR